MKVSVDTQTLSTTRAGSLTGVIALTHGPWAFPSRRWHDFPVVIVSWWLEALTEAARTGKPVECLFMDGPFFFTVSLLSAGKARIACMEQGRSRPSRVVRVQAATFARSVRTAAHALVHACRERGWRSRDITHLARLTLKSPAGA